MLEAVGIVDDFAATIGQMNLAKSARHRLQTEHGEHLAVRLDRPIRARRDDLCIFYTHGFGSSQSGEKARYFRARFLAEGIAFCSFDFRGHGDSGGSLFDLSLTRNLADCALVHGWLREQGFARLVQVGSSMGAGTSLWHAANHPEDLLAAIHIAPALEMDQGLLDAVGPAGAREWQETGRYTFSSALISTDLSWSLIEDLRAFDLTDLQLRYRTPTLIFQGKNDTSVSWRSVVEFAAGCRFDQLELRLLCDADHRLVDRLDTLGSQMLGFLEARRVFAEELTP